MNFNFSNIERYDSPFDHWVVSDFLDIEHAKKLSEEFFSYDDQAEDIVHYKGWIGEKKACNRWDRFPPLTYKTFSELLTPEFTRYVSAITNIDRLIPDIGMHGGGWHMCKTGGSLATHLDYSIHPKLKYQRKINLIIYLEEDYDPSWGGSLGLWSHNYENDKPLELVKNIPPLFNTAVLFDTSQNSWHGFPDPITCPEGKMRKSLAVYYVTDFVDEEADERYKALYVNEEDMTE